MNHTLAALARGWVITKSVRGRAGYKNADGGAALLTAAATIATATTGSTTAAAGTALGVCA